ncbi:hypothetical protein AeRB84_019405 [Aphanomyces euteiches]|nr:hypothetical protein AeRB84_019405 [Aphanomyces euteiches]
MEPEFGLYEQRKIISKKKTALAADEHTATDEHGIAIEAEDPKPDEIFDPNDAIYLMDAPDLEDDDHNESMDSTEKTRPGKRDPVKDPDVSPQSQIPLKVQAVESPPIPLKLDGSTPPNNLDEEELDEILNEPDQEYDPNEGIGYLGESAPADHLEVASRGLAMRVGIRSDRAIWIRNPVGPRYRAIFPKSHPKRPRDCESRLQQFYVTATSGTSDAICEHEAHWTIQLSRMSMEAEAQIFVTNAIREIEDRERLRIETFYAAMRHPDERIQSDKTTREQSVRVDVLRLWSEHVDEIRDRIQRGFQNSSEFQAAVLSAVMANDQVCQAQLSAKEEEIKKLKGLLDDIRSDVVGLRQGSEWVRSLEKELNTREADLLQSQNSVRQL